VPELPLNDHEGNAFACHLDGVCVTQLVRCEPATDASASGDAVQLDSD
jgi:hypothetical protein